MLLKESLRIRALHRGKKRSALIDDWENFIAFCEESKQSEALPDKSDSFHTL